MKYSKFKKYCSLLILLIILLESFGISTTSAEEGISGQGNTQDKFSYALTEAFDELPEGEKAPVALWIEDIDMSEAIEYAETRSGVSIDEAFEDIYTSEEIQNYIEEKRAFARELYINSNYSFASENLTEDDIIYISEYSPVILIYLTKADADALSCLPNVTALELYNGNVKNELDISIPLIEADTIRDVKSYSGSGIKVGMVEYGEPYLTDPALSPIASNIHLKSTDLESHATTVASIIVGQSVTVNGVTVKGIVPDAELYCASAYICSYYEAIEWLLTNGVNVINASCELGSDGFSTYGSAAKWIDHISVNHDVHFVISAGNSGSTGISSGAMAYNAVTVGGIDDHNSLNKSLHTIYSSSSYYNGLSGLTSKPDLCAPSVNITSSTGTHTGTSLSAPQVTGVIAQLCQIKPVLKVKQDVVKAILTAAVDDSTPHKYLPTDLNYDKFGAGVLNAYNCWYSAKNTKYASSYFTPSGTQQTFNMYVASFNTLMRVSLSYIKVSKYTVSDHITNPTPSGIYPLADLGLEIYDPNGNLVTYSCSTTNNTEIAEFVPAVYGNYTIKVRQFTPSTYNTYFGVAWY